MIKGPREFWFRGPYLGENMDNFIFSLNVTMPVFLTMVMGGVLRKLGIIDETFSKRLDKFVFKVALPLMLFENLATVDFMEVWDFRFVAFCFLATCGGITLSFLVSYLWKDKSIKGEFIQGAYRGSAAILGVAFIQNIYGSAGMAPLMIVASVPLYNIMAVVVLVVFGPNAQKMDRDRVMKTLKGIATNPIILGILIGCIWSILRIPVPTVLAKTVNNIAKVGTPLGLLSIGAAFRLEDISERFAPVVTASFIKILGLSLVFGTIAILMGFRTEKLIAIIIMLGSPTTVSGYIMAKNMGHEGKVSAGVVMLTTLFSAFTLTGWIFVLRSFALI